MPKYDDPLRAIYNYEPITDWLGTSGQPTEPQFLDIARAGYGAVINLALPSSDNAIANEGSIVTGHEMAYFHIPVVFESPKVEDLRLFFGVMQALELKKELNKERKKERHKESQKVWVHCVVNARVSAFVYQYLRYAKGVGDEAAKTRLLRKWLPEMDEVWRTFLALPQDQILGADT